MGSADGNTEGLIHFYALGEDRNWGHALVCKPNVVG
jgi:hypothetical protein